MQVKRFVAADMRRALELVRTEMGPDAVILSSRRIKEGVEIVTTLEAQPQVPEADRGMVPREDHSTGFESPLASDSAWGDQAKVNQAIHERLATAPGAGQVGAHHASAGGGTGFQQAMQGISTGPASGKTSQQLADEIEQARTRMLAARKAEAVTTGQGGQHPSGSADWIPDTSASKTPADRNRYTQNQADYNRRDTLQSLHAQESLQPDRESLQPDRESLQLDRDNLQLKKDSLQLRKNNLQLEEESLQRELDCLLKEQDGDSFEQESLQREHDSLQREHDSFQHGQANLQREQENLEREKLRVQQEQQALERERMKQDLQLELDRQRQLDQDQQLDSLRSELADMRLLLEEQLGYLYAEQEPVAQSPVHGALWNRYERMGLPVKAIVQVLSQTNPQGTMDKLWPESLAALSHQLPIQDGDIVGGGGVFAFVGPTGVGKTTTIGKLAARYVLKHGPNKVALVTTDTYRIAAHDQLKSLGRILKAPVKVVNDHADLPAVLATLHDYPLVLIDTAGLRPGDPQLKQQLRALQQQPQILNYLVLAATSQQQLMKASVQAYKSAGLQGCVLTKLDETASLGEALGVVLDQKLAVAYTTDGQDIPKDIEVARAYQLVSRAVALMKKMSTSSLSQQRMSSVRVANSDDDSDSVSRLSRAVSMVKKKVSDEPLVKAIKPVQTINDRQGVQELGHA